MLFIVILYDLCTHLLSRTMIQNEQSTGCLAILKKQAKKMMLQLLLQALLVTVILLSTTLYDHLYHIKALQYIVDTMLLTCSRMVNGYYSTTTKWLYHLNHQLEKPTSISCNVRDKRSTLASSDCIQPNIEQTNALYVKEDFLMLFKILYKMLMFWCEMGLMLNRVKYPRREPKGPCGHKDRNAFGGSKQHVDHNRLQAQFRSHVAKDA